jgi:SAM-dependent methyltransferase
MNKDILHQVEQYYSDKIKMHGATPLGVDWNGEESQFRRFHELMRVADDEQSESRFSILDFGCGYGGMLDYLQPVYGERISYTGYDLSLAMIEEAKVKYANRGEFTQALNPSEKWDFIVASGVFNVKQDRSNAEWLDYILQVLEDFHRMSTKGFAFNVLTSYSDFEYMRDYLYYAEPELFFTHCKKQFSRKVALLHDYPLYEFTIIVKK